MLFVVLGVDRRCCCWYVIDNDDKGGEERERKRNKRKLSDKLLSLAKRYRLNTEEEREVFGVLLTSSDYREAVERVLKLRKGEKSDRYILFSVCFVFVCFFVYKGLFFVSLCICLFSFDVCSYVFF